MYWMLSGSIVFALELPSLAGSHLVKGSALRCGVVVVVCFLFCNG